MYRFSKPLGAGTLEHLENSKVYYIRQGKTQCLNLLGFFWLFLQAIFSKVAIKSNLEISFKNVQSCNLNLSFSELRHKSCV